MASWMRGRLATVLAGLLLLGLLILALTVVDADASIPGPDGKLSACYKPSDGKARFVDHDQPCASGETRVSWDVSGREGPRGAAGEDGADGKDGADGAPGGVSGYEFVTHTVQSVQYATGGERDASCYPCPMYKWPDQVTSVTCPTGKVVIYGWGTIDSRPAGPSNPVNTSGIPTAANRWGIPTPSENFHENEGDSVGDSTMTVHATCVNGTT
jgi:hypothetical protein